MSQNENEQVIVKIKCNTTAKYKNIRNKKAI